MLRDGKDLGLLIEVREQYEDKGQETALIPISQDVLPPASEGPDAGVLAAMEQVKPLLALLPELTANPSKASISLYAGKMVVCYVHPRKRGSPRLRVFVGENCPDWVTPDPTYSAWCYIDDWTVGTERVVALLKEAPRRRAEDLAAGGDAYRRRGEPPGSTTSLLSQ